MNIAQAKLIPLQTFLEKIGLQPDISKGNERDIWYSSPFRPQEKDPSFHINPTNNTWYDFGKAKGGTIIDFVMEYKNCTPKAALNFIENNIKLVEIPNKKQQNLALGRVGESESKAFTLLKVTQDLAPSLQRYIRDDRKINLVAIKDFISEVHYKNQDNKTYFGIGVKNLSNGYEVRNPYFKGSIGKKDMAFIKGNGQGDSIAIFEGMFDFFSAVTHFGKSKFMEKDVLILNSIAFQEHAISKLKENTHYKNISLFIDNDRAGEAFTQAIHAAFPDRKIEHSFELYKGCKDFNEFLVGRIGINVKE